MPVIVQIPLSEADLSWLKQNRVPVRYLFNCEIAAYVADQIFSLNLHSTRVAKLVSMALLCCCELIVAASRLGMITSLGSVR